jgi:hypothetical protein
MVTTQAINGGVNPTIICYDIVMALRRPSVAVVNKTTGSGSRY